MKLPMMISAWSCLVLATFAISELRPDSSGLDLRGGTGGDCFYNDYPTCPPTTGMCSGCEGEAVFPNGPPCDDDDAQLQSLPNTYPVCENVSIGFTDCGLEDPYICDVTYECDQFCDLVGGDFRCVIALDENEKPVVLDQTVKDSSSALGGFCD